MFGQMTVLAFTGGGEGRKSEGNVYLLYLTEDGHAEEGVDQ